MLARTYCIGMCYKAIIVVCLLLWSSVALSAISIAEADGLSLMKEVYKKHRQYPFVYEEQSMVLIDREGNKETRKVKFFFRVEQDRRAKMMLLFESPEEVKGVAILAERAPNGVLQQSVYLPALGNQFVENSGELGDANFLGTDFSVENLTGEQLEDYQYERQRDVLINEKMYSIVDVHKAGADLNGIPVRRHFISQENVYLTRTDYYDELGRVRKRQSHHDLTQVLDGMWRANMMLMENMHNEHQTLIKIDRRVFSRDYVPAEVFTMEYLEQYSRMEIVETDKPDIEAEAELTGGARR